jgi:hypothetical protein
MSPASEFSFEDRHPPPLPVEGARPRSAMSREKKGPIWGNRMSKKRAIRVPGGYPGIAYPGNEVAYERQRGSAYGFFFEVLRRIKAGDIELARCERNGLEGLGFEFIITLLGVASAEPVKTWFGFAFIEGQGEARAWAGKVLGSIVASIGKWDTKLCETNAGYLSEKKKIKAEKQLAQVVVSPKAIMATVLRELQKALERRRTLRWIAEGYREELKDPGVTLRQFVPPDYWDYLPTFGLPEPSLEFFAQWEKFLWPVFKKNNPDLLEKLRSGKIPTRGIHRDRGWKPYHKEFKSALRTVLRLLEVAVLR